MRTTVSIVGGTAWVIAGILVALTAPGLIRAQGISRVTGLITDQSGAVVVGASIQVKELSTNVTLSAVSNDRGYNLLLQYQFGKGGSSA
jgi:hypothetical protein